MAVFFKYVVDGRVLGVGCMDEYPEDYDFHEMPNNEYITEEEYNNILEHTAQKFTYVSKIVSGEITLDDVPEYIRSDVEYEYNIVSARMEAELDEEATDFDIGRALEGLV